MEKLRLYKPFTVLTGLIIRVLWLLLGLDVILFAKTNPLLFIVLFYIIYSLIGLASAFTSISWLNFIIKIIPRKYIGRFFGIRSTICGVFEATGALLMGVIVARLSFPYNYGFLFLVVSFLTFISLYVFSLAQEDKSPDKDEETVQTSYLWKIFGVVKNDRNFVNYLWTVALIGGLGRMPFAFQIIIAKEKLNIIETQVSYATFILLIAQTAGYIIWGFLGDRYGFKVTLEMSAVIYLPTLLFTFLMSNFLVFYLSMGFYGIAQSARNINENNLAINLCRDESSQPLYIGLRNLLMGPFFAIAPVIAGLIFDYIGYNMLFIISTFFMIAGLYMLLKYVKEYI